MPDKILVTPEYLKKKEEEWLLLFDESKKAFEKASNHVELLALSFDGMPVRKIVTDFRKKRQEGETSFIQLKKQLAKLSVIAEIYGQAERSNRDVTADN